jgi:hypothetical protein
MPGPDEIRRYQQEHPVSPAMQELLAAIPKVEFDPLAARRRMLERFQQEYGAEPGPDKDYPYVKASNEPGPVPFGRVRREEKP